MTIFLDLDGVLVDFVGGACRRHGKPNPYSRPEAQGQWGLEELIGVEPAAFWEPLGEEFWANLSPTHDWHQILTAACAAAGGEENVCLLTSPCDTPGCESGKRRWIENWLPQFRERFLIGAPKHLVAGQGKILVDDSDANVAAWSRAGGTSCLVPRPWNLAHRIADKSAATVASILNTIANNYRCPTNQAA